MLRCLWKHLVTGQVARTSPDCVDVHHTGGVQCSSNNKLQAPLNSSIHLFFFFWVNKWKTMWIYNIRFTSGCRSRELYSHFSVRCGAVVPYVLNMSKVKKAGWKFSGISMMDKCRPISISRILTPSVRHLGITASRISEHHTGTHGVETSPFACMCNVLYTRVILLPAFSSRHFLVKPGLAQLRKKFPVSYGAWRLITVLIKTA